MKELSIEEKALRYNEAVINGSRLWECGAITKENYEYIFPELAESEDEIIRKDLISHFNETIENIRGEEIIPHESKVLIGKMQKWIAWLKKQGKQKLTQEIEPFEAEHGKYYYCIKDYLCGGKKQASKGDVVQALRGLPIMGLKDASEYFLPVNFIKCNSAWGEEDEKMLKAIHNSVDVECLSKNGLDYVVMVDWFNSLKDRVQQQPMQEWSEEDLNKIENALFGTYAVDVATRLLNKIKSLRPQNTWKPSDEQIRRLEYFLKLWGKTEDIENTKVFETVKSLLNDLKKLKQ